MTTPQPTVSGAPVRHSNAGLPLHGGYFESSGPVEPMPFPRLEFSPLNHDNSFSGSERGRVEYVESPFKHVQLSGAFTPGLAKGRARRLKLPLYRVCFAARLLMTKGGK